MSIIKTVADAVLTAVYPNRCAGCDAVIGSDENFCDYCFEMLPFTAADRVCRVCGLVKEQCQCRFHAFHFSGFTAPFYNEDPAKKAMYRLKFSRKLYIADFFAKQMALSVRNNFGDVPFDAAVYVPMTVKRKLKRGYNQSRELAVRTARLLDIPLVENALGCNPRKKIQHETRVTERFKNAAGMYFPNLSLKGRTVSLIDDIKTTGATLDECAKALYKAGAVNVYCVTGLITRKKKKTKSKRQV